MTEYLPRSAWTSTSPGGATLTGSKLLGVACHYPASGDIITANLTREQVASRLRGWRDYHVNTRGWSDIGYQVAVDGQGRVWDLRGITRVPAAHASSANPDANEEFGACLFVVGNNESPTQAAIQAFRDWRTSRWLAKWPGRTNVRGHRQVPGAQTECPGDKIIALIAAGALTGTGTTPPPPPEEDVTTPSDIVGTDLDGSPMTMGQLAARINYYLGGSQAAAPIYDKLAALSTKVGAIPTTHPAHPPYPAIDYGAIADAVVERLPEGTVTQATVEAGVRAVLGSLDNETAPKA